MIFAAFNPAPLALPILVGGLAVYLLLPRPQPYPKWLGISASLVALLLVRHFLLPVSPAVPVVETILFYGFSALALLGGVLLVTQPNPARGAVAFALVVLSTCGLFLLQAAPFLMAGTIIIYAGAIIVTFLFVIMLSQQHGPSDADGRSREPFLATLAGCALLAVLLFAVQKQYDTSGIDDVLAATEAAAQLSGKPQLRIRDSVANLDPTAPTTPGIVGGFEKLQDRLAEPQIPADQVAKALDEFHATVLAEKRRVGELRPTERVALSAFAGTPANKSTGAAQLPAANVVNLGRALFSDYLLGVEMGGTLLLVATIGAIAITHRHSRRAA